MNVANIAYYTRFIRDLECDLNSDLKRLNDPDHHEIDPWQVDMVGIYTIVRNSAHSLLDNMEMLRDYGAI